MRRALRRSACLILAIGIGSGGAARGQAVSPQAPAASDPALTLRPLSGPRADVAALILGGQESGSLRAAALAAPGCPPPPEAGEEGRRAPVALWLEIEAASLLDAVAFRDDTEPPESVRLEMYVYGMTRGGEIAASLAEWVRLPLAALTALLPGGGVRLETRLELPSGEAQLRVLVREPRSQRFALRVVGVTASHPAAAGPTLGPPLFSAAVGRWLVAGSGQARDDLPGPAAALPVVSAGGAGDFRLSGCRLSGAKLEARLLDSQGRPAAGGSVKIEPRTDAAPGAQGTLQVPELLPGLYRLEVSAQAPAGESRAAAPVFVAPAAVGAAGTGGPRPWTALGGAQEPQPEPEELLGELDRSGRSAQIQAFRAAYRQVLGRLATGRREEAVELLARLESEALSGDGKPQTLRKRLDLAQDLVTRELLASEPECVLPLLLLHLDLHRRYLEAPDLSSRLLSATRGRIRALAGAYATRAKSEMAPALAAVSLVELAVELERSHQRVSALIVLRDAIALDPANPDALLELAYQYENHGFDEQALALLEALLEVEPRSDEGRLRLAMHRFRAGRGQEAVEILDRLLADGSSPWVLAVAYQELARFLLDSDRPQEAARRLQEAVVRLPQVQRLHIQLAYALDRSGDRLASARAAAAGPAAAERASPRLLYRVTPPEENSRARSALVRHATGRLALLAQVLSASEGPG